MNILYYTLHFLKQHWFKLIIVAILLVIYFKKEIRLGINFNTPKQAQVEIPAVTTTTDTKQSTEGEATIEESSQIEQMSIKDQFANLPFWRMGRTDTPDALPEVSIEILDDYINRFARLARGEKEKHNVPAAIVLASALLQSEVGQHPLVKNTHNHFRLKCTEDWKGELSWHGGQCYRAYDRTWTSFRDYSLYLTTGINASFLEIPKDDYAAWAKAIEATDFFDQNDLADRLVKIIEKYNLQQLDVE